jgi:hypothetical protein
MYELGDKIEIPIHRTESNFDRACDAATKYAWSMFGIDDCCHSSRVKGWDRSSCSIQVKFKGYSASLGYGGSGHTYVFEAWCEKCHDDLDDDED